MTSLPYIFTKRHKLTGVIVVAGILISGFSACHTDPAPEARVPYQVPDSLMKTLAIDTVKTSKITDAFKFNGTVDFNTDKVINIFPLITGNIQDVKVMLGDYVHAGQVLGTVNSAEVANYNAALINAETNVRSTKTLLEQQRELFKSGLASQVDITNAEVNYDQAIAAKTAAERILSINGNSKNGQYVIKSPIDGFIVQKNANDGMAIRTDNNTGLFTISDLKDVWVQANVYEENIGKVHQGDEADVTTISYPDRVFKGKVDRLMNVLDPTTKVMKMRIVLQNPGYVLKPAMFATVSVNNTEDKEAISVASSTLVFDHSQYYVLIYKSKKDIEIRAVDVISINGKTAYIKSGVKPGELLIASQAILIYGSLNS